MAKSLSVPELLARALELGREHATLLEDVAAWRLTRAAWERLSLELAGASSMEELTALRERVDGCEFLSANSRATAGFWNSGPGTLQDRPALDISVKSDQRAYAEMLASGLTLAQLSGVVSVMVAERRHPAWWGQSEGPEPGAEASARIGAIAQELAALDQALVAAVRVTDFRFTGSGRAGLMVDGKVHAFAAESIGRFASTVAESVLIDRQARRAA